MSVELKNSDMALAHCWNSKGTWGNRSCEALATIPGCRECNVFRQAGRQLLERPAPEAYAAHWAKQIGQADQRQADKGSAVLICRLADEYFAFIASKIGEVMPSLPSHQIPHTRGSILKGMVSLRGELQLLVSLRQVLDIADEHEAAEDAWMIKAWSGSETLIFSVSELCTVYRYQAAELKPAPATLSAAMAALTTGILQWNGHAVALLNASILYEQMIRGLR